MPYLIGPNSAPIRPNSSSARNSNGREFSSKPAMAMAAAPISASFSRRATRALSKRSASSPPKADSRKKGTINMAPANVTRDSPDWPPILNRISKASAFFRKLSLKAEKNWHQNNGAKRREARSDCDIDLSWDRGELPVIPAQGGNPGAATSCRAALHPRLREGDDNCSRLSFGDAHQQALGLGVLDAIHQLAGFVIVPDRLGQRDAALDQHNDAHREIAFHRQVERHQDDAADDHGECSGKGDIGEDDPRMTVVKNRIVHRNAPVVRRVQTKSSGGIRLAGGGAFSQPGQDVGRIGPQARTETLGRELLGDGDRAGRGIERLERRLGRICLDLVLAQAGERRLGFRERAGENRGTLDAAAACDPDRLRRSGDPPPAFEL